MTNKRIPFLKNFLIFFLLVGVSACKTHRVSSKEISGNWSTESSSLPIELYTEMFISENGKIHYYTDNIGLKPPTKYVIRKNNIYQSMLGSNMERMGKLELNDGSLSIKSKKNWIQLIKIPVSEIKLGDYLNDQVDEEKYRISFLLRQADWQIRKSHK